MVTILKKKEPPTLRNSQFFADSIMKTTGSFRFQKLAEPEVLFIWNVFTVFASEREFLHT
jgi:hypothetical protein